MKKLYSLLLMCLLSTAIFASTTGKIVGVVTDSESGEVLIGVNVIISELGVGAATDMDGYFAILNVPPGSFSLSANYIGYGTVTYSDVEVRIDLTTTQNFKLSSLALEGEEVVIEATKPVVQRDVASSQRNLSASEIVDMPVNSVSDVVGLQAGVEGLSIRAGGANEMVLMMDGISLKDDRTGEPVTGISLSSVKEVMIQSGGFNAEYGDLQAGLINVVTREGSKDKYSFSLSYRYSPPAPKHFGMSMFDKDAYFMRPYLDDDVAWTGTDNGAWDEYTQSQYPTFSGWNTVSEQLLSNQDPSDDLTPTGAQRLFKWQARRKGNITEPDYKFDVGLGGPVPVIGKSLGNLRFFASFNGNQNMYMVPLSEDGYRDWVGNVKLTSDINTKMKLSLNAFAKNITASSSSGTGQPTYFSSVWAVANIFSTNSQQSWKLLYPDYYCSTEINTRMVSGKLTHLLNTNSYYEGTLEYSQTSYSTNPGPRRDSTLYDLFPGPEEFLTDEGPFGFDDGTSESVAGIFSMGLKSNSRDTSKTSRIKARVDYTNQIDKHNQIKAGVQFEYISYDMNYGAINPVLPVGRPFSVWQRSPYQMDVYVQDKLEFEGWIATLGLRGEYFDPNTDWYDVDVYDPAFYSSSYDPATEDEIPTRAAKGTFTLLPRLGISHPITTNSKLYFNYGHMRQKFNADELFGVRRYTDRSIAIIGDPELPPEKTIAYEIGYDQSLFDRYLIHLSGYYKDKSDQSNTVGYKSNSVDYDRYDNIFYEDIRGFEFEFRKNRGDWITGFGNYTYSIRTYGNFGVRNYNLNPADQREEENTYYPQGKPLPQPRMSFNVSLHTPRYFGPVIAGEKLLANWHLAFTGNWKAGAYSSYGNVPGIVNNVRWKDTYNVNSKLSKTFHMGNVDLTFLAEAFNLFNFKHFSTAGMATGQNYDDYKNSLHFKEEVYEELGFNHISGDDRYGDYRPEDVSYQPLAYQNSAYFDDGSPRGGEEGVYYWTEQENMYMSYSAADGNWTPVDDGTIQKVLDDKAYISNPPNQSLMFLSPRDIFVGIKLAYNF